MPPRLNLEVESPGGRQVIPVEGDRRSASLAELLQEASLPLNTRCGQRGLCDGCTVELLAGRLVHESGDHVAREEGTPVRVRGCEYRLADCEHVRIRIPIQSLLAEQPQVVSEFRINVSRAHRPLSGAGLGVAIDLGTTTVALLLVDLTDGTIRARATGLNRQTHLGEDVLTRINFCMSDPTMLARLRDAAVHETLGPLLVEALTSAGASADQVACVVVAGNTTMLHLLAGVDPTPMGFAPFTPVFLEHRIVRDLLPDLVDESTGEGPPIHLLPGAAA